MSFLVSMAAASPSVDSRATIAISAVLTAALPLWPMLGFLNANKLEDQIGLQAISAAFAIYLALSGALFLLTSMVVSTRLAARLVVGFAVFFTALHFYADYLGLSFVDRSPHFVAAFLLSASLLAGLVAYLGRSGRLLLAVAAFAGVTSVTSAAPLVMDSGKLFEPTETADASTRPARPAAAASSDRPNIYAFVFDGYMGSDLLLELYGHDNSDFVEALELRGFTVPQESWSNFVTTVYAVNALLNPSWMDLPPDEFGSRLTESRAYLGHTRNEVQDQLRGLGYSFSMLSHTGYAPVRACAPYCMGTNPKLSLLEVQYIRTLPVYDILKIVAPEIVWDWVSSIPADPLLVFELRPVEMPQPALYLAHLLLPHPPYVRTADCSTRIDTDFDFEVRAHDDLTNAEERDLYLDQLRCANLRMLQIADRLEETDPEAIILFTSDHGWKLRLAGREATLNADGSRNILGMLEARFSNFWAARLPDRCTHLIDETVFLADTFSIVTACLSGGQYSRSDRLYTVSREGVVTDFTVDVMGEKR